MFAMVVTVVSAGVALLLALPAISDLLCLLRPRTGRREPAPGTSLPRLLFLVPAHDEELLVTACVQSIQALDYPAGTFRTVVIADNCADRTVELARAAGAECLERRDPLAPGKPQAVGWALRQLALGDYDACVIVDADTVVDRAFARALARWAPLRGKLLQACERPLNETDSWLTRLAGLLARRRGEVALPLKESAGLNCPLTCDGTCIGGDILVRDGWQATSLTENWELYARYTVAGVPIHFAREAQIHYQEARTLRQAASQRRRWLAGRLWVLRHWGGALIRSSHITPHQKLDALCELGAPSPVLHLALALILAAITLTWLPRPAGTAIAALAVGSLGSQVVATLVALRRHPRPWATLSALLMLPVYGVWRLFLTVLTLLTLRDTRWRKTEHHGDALPAAAGDRTG